MAIDCEKLSENAQKIFKKLEPHFPPDPWKKPRWFPEGRIIDNGEFDLRKSADRELLEEKLKSFVGYCMKLEASSYWKSNKESLDGFELTSKNFPKSALKDLEILIILGELDFQIETMDIVEGY